METSANFTYLPLQVLDGSKIHTVPSVPFYRPRKSSSRHGWGKNGKDYSLYLLTQAKIPLRNGSKSCEWTDSCTPHYISWPPYPGSSHRWATNSWRWCIGLIERGRVKFRTFLWAVICRGFRRRDWEWVRRWDVEGWSCFAFGSSCYWGIRTGRKGCRVTCSWDRTWDFRVGRSWLSNFWRWFNLFFSDRVGPCYWCFRLEFCIFCTLTWSHRTRSVWLLLLCGFLGCLWSS